VRYITEHWEEKEIAVMDRWRIGSQVRELKPRVHAGGDEDRRILTVDPVPISWM
jgi:hypothetical protein